MQHNIPHNPTQTTSTGPSAHYVLDQSLAACHSPSLRPSATASRRLLSTPRQPGLHWMPP
jgi:hypothetical protein